MQVKSLQLIQVLRGIASLLVVLLHATGNFKENLGRNFLGDFFAFGGSGVDIFFVLSGFIITYTSFHHLSDSNKLFPFLRRRFVRIYPIYWVIISGFLLVQVLLPWFYKTHYSFDVFNILGTYLLAPGHTMVNGVSWTLTNELFFYVIFSLAFLVKNKRMLLAAMGVYSLLICLVYIMGYNPDKVNDWVDILVFPMNLEFFMGVIAALVFTKLPARYYLPMLITGGLLFLTGGLLKNQGYMLFDNHFNRVIYFGIPSWLVVIAVAGLETVKKINVHGFLLSLGDASYSLYLLHLPVLAAATKLMAKTGLENNVLLHVLMIAIVLLICYGSIVFFKRVEKPLINMLNASKSHKGRYKIAG